MENYPNKALFRVRQRLNWDALYGPDNPAVGAPFHSFGSEENDAEDRSLLKQIKKTASKQAFRDLVQRLRRGVINPALADLQQFYRTVFRPRYLKYIRFWLDKRYLYTTEGHYRALLTAAVRDDETRESWETFVRAAELADRMLMRYVEEVTAIDRDHMQAVETHGLVSQTHPRPAETVGATLARLRQSKDLRDWTSYRLVRYYLLNLAWKTAFTTLGFDRPGLVDPTGENAAWQNAQAQYRRRTSDLLVFFRDTSYAHFYSLYNSVADALQLWEGAVRWFDSRDEALEVLRRVEAMMTSAYRDEFDLIDMRV